MSYSWNVIRFKIDGRIFSFLFWNREKISKRGFNTIRSSLSLFKFFPMGRWKQNWRMNKEIEEFPPGIHSRKEYKIKMEWKIKSNCLNFQTAKRFMKNSFLNSSNNEMYYNRLCITYWNFEATMIEILRLYWKDRFTMYFN